jgi:hypothetical protein
VLRRLPPLLLALSLVAGCGGTVGTQAGGGGPAAPADPAPAVSGTAGFQVVAVSAAAGVTWALGTADCPGGGRCTSVLRSPDGGRTWAGVTAPAAPVPGKGLLTSRLPVPDDARWIRFGTATDGWVFGGGLWATHDGGASWRRVPTGGLEVMDLAADGPRAYAVLAECGRDNGADCVLPRLTTIVPGGEGLTEAAELPAGRVDRVRVSAAGGRAVVAVDDTVYTSTSAGWVPARPCGSLLTATAAADGRTVVAGCVEPALSARYLSLRRSTDGVRWDAARGPSPRLTDGLTSLAATGPDDVTVAWTGTQSDGGLLTSADGGRSWDPVGEPTQWWVDVTATGPRDLLAVPYPETDRYWASSDRGRSWRPIRVG